MEQFIIIMKLTDQGVKTVKTTTQIIGDAQKILADRGGQMTACYLTMGDIDYIAVCEAPNDEAILSFVLSLGATGNVRTNTLKAFPAGLVEKLEVMITI